jgi:Uma2 family endonuclease
MATANAAHTEQRFLLQGVPWTAYQSLREAPENAHVRLTYDRGELELMSPSQLHEQYAHLIGRMIDAWTEEQNVDVMGCRTTTFRSEDLGRGLEPDNCYYIEHEPQVREREEVDLSVDPPPDLAIEIELSRPAIDELAIYAALGVPELWRFDGRKFDVFRLSPDRSYQPANASGCLPGIPLGAMLDVLARLTTASETTLIREFRAHVRDREG